MAITVKHISELNSADLFEMRQFTLGDQTGKWAVVDGDLVLGLYKDKVDAIELAESYQEIDLTTPTDPKALAEALAFADELEKEEK